MTPAVTSLYLHCPIFCSFPLLFFYLLFFSWLIKHVLVISFGMSYCYFALMSSYLEVVFRVCYYILMFQKMKLLKRCIDNIIISIFINFMMNNTFFLLTFVYLIIYVWYFKAKINAHKMPKNEMGWFLSNYLQTIVLSFTLKY